MTGAADRLVVLGRIAGVFGVRGELRVESFTEPREGICDYAPWLLRQAGAVSERRVATGRRHGRGMVVTLDGVTDRDQALALLGAEILVRRSQLPEAKRGEHYWVDLDGLKVETLDGRALGSVSHLFATGANDVLVVRGERERLIPCIPGVIRAVDAEAGVVRVDWDPEF